MSRRTHAAERFAERRRQEDDAPRLRAVAPDLIACQLALAERRADSRTADVSHTRHVVVERAPALFVIACSDPWCRDGGHDISTMVLRGLREYRTDIRGEDSCQGNVGTAHCGRILDFKVVARYVRENGAPKPA